MKYNYLDIVTSSNRNLIGEVRRQANKVNGGIIEYLKNII